MSSVIGRSRTSSFLLFSNSRTYLSTVFLDTFTFFAIFRLLTFSKYICMILCFCFNVITPDFPLTSARVIFYQSGSVFNCYCGSLLSYHIHALFVMYRYNFQLNNLKMISGLVAMAMLSGVIITGWMRKWKKTRLRHLIHLSFGFGTFTFVLLHLIF